MCSIDILESMVGISSIINKLILDKFEIFNKNKLMLLANVEFASSDGKEKPDIKLSAPTESTYQNIRNAFLKILLLALKDNSSAIRAANKYLSLLSDIVSGFQVYKKISLDKDTQTMITEALEMAKKNNDDDLCFHIINCKNIIYKES